jgi:hypothetical protein
VVLAGGGGGGSLGGAGGFVMTIAVLVPSKNGSALYQGCF